jgi:thiol:disulfide interchange protein DsbD
VAGVAAMGALSALIVGPCVAPPLMGAVLYIAQSARSGARRRGAVPARARHGRAADRVRHAGGTRHADQRAVDDGGAARVRVRVPRPGDLDVVARVAGCGDAGAVGPARVGRMATWAFSQGANRRARSWRRASRRWCSASSARRNCWARSPADTIRLQPLAGVTGARAEAIAFKRIKSVEDLDREIAAARAANKPVLLDFYADWCVSCKEMEKYVFTRPDVHAALADYVLLQADVTANDATDQALMQRFGIIGPPMSLFFKDGQERRGLRLTGFEDAAAFVQRAHRGAE